jgi:hypothetical protein
LPKAYEAFQQSAAEHGSKLQAPKTEFLYFHREPLHPDIQKWIAQEKFITRFEACEIAGGIVAKSAEAAAPLLNDMLLQHSRFVERILHHKMPTQAAIILLRASLLPAMTHLIRTTNPLFTRDVAKRFDQLIRDAASEKLQVRLDPGSTQHEQFTAPISEGGFGFRSVEKLAPLAYVASQARTRTLLKDAGITTSLETLQLREQILDQVRTLIGEAEDSKKLESLKAQLPMRGQSFDDFYTEEPSMADELQSNLTVLLNLDTHVKLNPNNEQDRVRMDSLRKPNAGRPLTTLPTEPALKISNTEYTLLTKIRLADKTVKLPEFCGHCKKRFEGPNAAAHFLGCQGLMPVQGCKRHNAIVKILKKWIERAGGIATVEPRGLTAKSNDRPDIDTMLGLDSYFLDVTVLNTLAASNLARGEAFLQHAEARKKRKYHGMGQAHGAEVIPFALDVYGVFGDDALEFVNKLADYADQNASNYSPMQIREGLMNEVAVALQKGNAAMMNRALNAIGRAQHQRREDEQAAALMSDA